MDNTDFILDENSTQIEQPRDISIPLKPHQLAMIHKMLELEDSDKKLIGADSQVFTTNFGAICDRVGSGKSLSVLGLLSVNKLIYPKNRCIRSFGNMVHIYDKSNKYLPLNIIVVPHGIFTQWQSYINDYTSLNVQYIKNNKAAIALSEKIIKFLESGEEEFQSNIILVSSTQYNKVAKSFNITYSNRISVSRLIVDEADSVKIPSSGKINAEFTWFISSSDHKLQNPRGYNIYQPYTYINWNGDEIQTTRSVTIDKMTHSGYFRNLLLDLEFVKTYSFKSSIFLKSKNEFIENSFNLPEIRFKIINCLGNLYVNVLNGLVSQEVMNMINAGDINSAVEAMGCDTQDEEGLIKLVTKDLEKNLKNKEIELNAKQQMTYSSQAAKKVAIDKLMSDIIEIKEKINNIKERVVDTNACPICCDEITNKCILQCCNNAFCLECITISLTHKPCCPLCRKEVGKKDMIVMKDSIEEKVEEIDEDDDSKRSKIDNLIKYLTKLMNKNLKSKVKKHMRKVLIFSEYDKSFNEIESFLQSSPYKYDKLKGSTTTINNKVENYKDGNIDILLLNSKYFGSGLNLENTTDMFLFHKMTETMEKQVIGRAQRPGRKSPLNVYRLCYENEM